jgi:hypothetical protein
MYDLPRLRKSLKLRLGRTKKPRSASPAWSPVRRRPRMLNGAQRATVALTMNEPEFSCRKTCAGPSAWRILQELLPSICRMRSAARAGANLSVCTSIRVFCGDDGAASAAGPSAAGWALRFRHVMGALQAGRARRGACRAAKRRQPRREHVDAAAARARHGRVGRGRSGCLAWMLGRSD